MARTTCLMLLVIGLARSVALESDEYDDLQSDGGPGMESELVEELSDAGMPAAAADADLPATPDTDVSESPGWDQWNETIRVKSEVPPNCSEAEHALVGDEVFFNFTLRVINGGVIDSTEARPPRPFILGTRGGVLQAWDRRLEGMCLGERRILTIDPAAAFGVAGQPPDIPPNATIELDTTLVGLVPSWMVTSSPNAFNWDNEKRLTSTNYWGECIRFAASRNDSFTAEMCTATATRLWNELVLKTLRRHLSRMGNVTGESCYGSVAAAALCARHMRITAKQGWPFQAQGLPVHECAPLEHLSWGHA
jgi:hypothetical protein